MLKYPITPEYIKAAPAELEKLYSKMEEELIRDICERLKYNDGEATGTVQRELERLKLRGYDTRKIAKAISQLTGQGEAAARKTIEAAIADNEAFYREVYDAMGKEFSEYAFLEKEVAAIKAQTLDTFRNLTQSYGFSIRKLDGTVQWLDPSKAYQQVLDNALFKAQSGASYGQCIRGAVSELTSSGMTYIEYYKEDGVKHSHVNRVDVAVRRAITTGIAQISAKYSDMAMKELDTPYMQVTQHIGARDKGEGWQNHESWQGKVYSIKENDKFPSIYEVCGLGEVDGLCGVNCRHGYFPWFDGLSPMPEKLEKTYVTYNGKRYSDYEATQVMRKAETQLRDLKRKMIGESASGDRERYLKHAARHRAIKEEYERFAKATGNRSQYYQRATILDWGPKQAKEAEKALQAAGI